MDFGGRVLIGTAAAGAILGGSLALPGIAAADEILPTGAGGVHLHPYRVGTDIVRHPRRRGELHGAVREPAADGIG